MVCVVFTLLGTISGLTKKKLLLKPIYVGRKRTMKDVVAQVGCLTATMNLALKMFVSTLLVQYGLTLLTKKFTKRS